MCVKFASVYLFNMVLVEINNMFYTINAQCITTKNSFRYTITYDTFKTYVQFF
jgi:hypothetical protein